MALYAYQAFTKDGKSVNGTMDAASVQEVRDKLTRSGVFPTSIVRAEQAGKPWWSTLWDSLLVRVSPEDVIFFTKQLAVLLKAGIPLLQALELLIEQTEKGLHRILIRLKDGIKEGRSLADGLSQYPSIFDTTYVQLVKAGEASGRLETILERLVTYLERSQELRKKVSGAMRMPLIQLAIIFIVVGVIYAKCRVASFNANSYGAVGSYSESLWENCCSIVGVHCDVHVVEIYRVWWTDMGCVCFEDTYYWILCAHEGGCPILQYAWYVTRGWGQPCRILDDRV